MGKVGVRGAWEKRDRKTGSLSLTVERVRVRVAVSGNKSDC